MFFETERMKYKEIESVITYKRLNERLFRNSSTIQKARYTCTAPLCMTPALLEFQENKKKRNVCVVMTLLRRDAGVCRVSKVANHKAQAAPLGYLSLMSRRVESHEHVCCDRPFICARRPHTFASEPLARGVVVDLTHSRQREGLDGFNCLLMRSHLPH